MMTDLAIQKAREGLIVVGEAVLVFVIGLIVFKILMKVCEKALNKSKLDPSLHKFIINSIKIVLIVLLIVTVLGSLGIATSTFVAILGAGGIAIALALKDSLANVAGGIILLVTKPFKKGDYIDIIEVAGIVETIDLFYTTLKTFDNKVIGVPNGKITNSVLINYSKENFRRVDCLFSIGYNDSIEEAKNILLAITESNEDIIMEPEPIIGVAGQHNSRIDIDLKVWCLNEKYWDVKYFLEENVKLAFDEAGITIPYPQMAIHLKKNNS